MGLIAGWLSIALAIFSLAPSFVPGAMSMLGMIVSLVALIISVFSVRKAGKRFFKATMTIVVGGVFLVNDGLRVWDPLGLPVHVKLFLYGVAFFVVMGCVFFANALAGNKKQF